MKAQRMKLRHLAMTYLGSAVLVTLVFVSLFHSSLLANSILFYRGCSLLVVASLIVFVVLYSFRRRFGAEVHTLLSAIVASASLNLSFFVLLPVTIDRSVSTFVLAYIGSEDRAKSRDEIHDYFVSQYVNHEDAIGRRLMEQIVSRNVAEGQGRYTLTAQGKGFLSFARVMCKLYGIQPVYLKANLDH